MRILRQLMNRETFMGVFVVSVGGVAGLIFGIPIIGFVLAPLIKQPTEVWRDVGAIADFKIGETKQVVFRYPETLDWAGSTANTAAWLSRTSTNGFTAFAVYCTHLGCPVHWFGDAKIFLCPCHGSVFNADGTVAGGPAPRPLFTYETRVQNGRVQIKTTHLPVVNPIGQ